MMKIGTLVAHLILTGDVEEARDVASLYRRSGTWTVAEVRAITGAIRVAGRKFPGFNGNVTLDQFMRNTCPDCGKLIPTSAELEAECAAECADAGFDGGEFSGPARDSAWEQRFCTCIEERDPTP